MHYGDCLSIIFFKLKQPISLERALWEQKEQDNSNFSARLVKCEKQKLLALYWYRIRFPQYKGAQNK